MRREEVCMVRHKVDGGKGGKRQAGWHGRHGSGIKGRHI